MRTYVSVFKLRMSNMLQYRAAALAGIATQFFFGFVFIMVFEAFYSHALVDPPMSLPQLITYVWLQQAFLAFIMLWFRDNELFQLITSGNIAYELCRPSDLYGFWYAKLLAQRLASAAMRCLPILVIACFMPQPYRMSLPPDPLTALLFAVTLLLGLLLLVAISMLIYISVFVTMSPTGSLILFSITGEFLAGMTIPIPLMPNWAQDIVYLLPFWLTADLPFRVYTEHIGNAEALRLIGIQAAWLIAVVAIGRFAMSRAMRRVVVQGG